MFLRTRLAVLTGMALLATSGLATSGLATTASAQQLCDGQVVTDFVPAGGALYVPPVNPNGPNVILGTPGIDNIDARGGNDTVCGLDGNDDIRGGTGDDRIFGQGGDDDMRGGDGNDVLNGGPHFEGDRGDGGPPMFGDNCPNTEVTINC